MSYACLTAVKQESDSACAYFSMKSKAPKKYWDDLTPDFDIAAKRRIFDSG